MSHSFFEDLALLSRASFAPMSENYKLGNTCFKVGKKFDIVTKNLGKQTTKMTTRSPKAVGCRNFGMPLPCIITRFPGLIGSVSFKMIGFPSIPSILKFSSKIKHPSEN